MQAKMFKDLVQASSIVDVMKLVEKAEIKTTLSSDKTDFANFIKKQYDLQCKACNHAYALATQKRRACQFLGGTERQYRKMWELEIRQY